MKFIIVILCINNIIPSWDSDKELEFGNNVYFPEELCDTKLVSGTDKKDINQSVINVQCKGGEIYMLPSSECSVTRLRKQ